MAEVSCLVVAEVCCLVVAVSVAGLLLLLSWLIATTVKV